MEAIKDALNAIAVEPVSIQKKKGLLGVELFLSKPKENSSNGRKLWREHQFRKKIP